MLGYVAVYNRDEIVQNKSSLLLKINLQNTQTLQLFTINMQSEITTIYNQYAIGNYNYLQSIYNRKLQLFTINMQSEIMYTRY